MEKFKGKVQEIPFSGDAGRKKWSASTGVFLLALVVALVALELSFLPTAYAAETGEALISVRAFRFTGHTVFSDDTLNALVADVAGHDLSMAALEGIADRVTRYYRDHGYPVARAYLPPQRNRRRRCRDCRLRGSLSPDRVAKRLPAEGAPRPGPFGSS